MHVISWQVWIRLTGISMFCYDKAINPESILDQDRIHYFAPFTLNISK